MTRPSAPASQRTSSWSGTSSRRTVGPGIVTVPSAGVGRAHAGPDWVDSFTRSDRGRLLGSMVGAGADQYYKVGAAYVDEPSGVRERGVAARRPIAASR